MSSSVGGGSSSGQSGTPAGFGNVVWYRKTSDCSRFEPMSVATSRARCPSARQSTLFVIITLSLTYSPMGWASAMPFLYASTMGFMCFAALKLNPIAPTPLRPASSYVGGLPQACQMGGWGFLYGFGRMFRGGTETDTPSYEYSPSRHIFGNSARTSSYIALVSSFDGMPNAVTSRA